jgi:hypothetical protein
MIKRRKKVKRINKMTLKMIKRRKKVKRRKKKKRINKMTLKKIKRRKKKIKIKKIEFKYQYHNILNI